MNRTLKSGPLYPRTRTLAVAPSMLSSGNIRTHAPHHRWFDSFTSSVRQ